MLIQMKNEIVDFAFRPIIWILFLFSHPIFQKPISGKEKTNKLFTPDFLSLELKKASKNTKKMKKKFDPFSHFSLQQFSSQGTDKRLNLNF
jgi:hypothetical protein